MECQSKIWNPVLLAMVRKQIIKIIEDVRPDIIHAHTIFPAKMINDLGIPSYMMITNIGLNMQKLFMK